MNKIDGFVAIAPKIKSGAIEYCLWTNDDGALYVQITKNVTEAEHPGTHSNLLFRVSDYLNKEAMPSVMHGIDPEKLTKEATGDNNDAGFVKAILKHLFP